MTLKEFLIDEFPLGGNDLIIGLLCPALVALTILGLARLLFARQTGAGPVATAAAFVAAYPPINIAAPSFPPRSAGDWLFVLALPAGIAAGAAAKFDLPRIVRLILATGVLGAVLFCMMQPAHQTRSPAQWWMLWAILLAILTAAWFFCDAAVSADLSIISAIGLLGILLGACILIQLSGSLKFSMQGLALVSAIATGVAAICMGYPRTAITGGMPLTGIAIVGTLLAVSIEPLFVDVKIAHALLIAAAPVLLWLGRFLRVAAAPGWLRAGLRLLLPAIPVLLALALAGARAFADFQDTGSTETQEYEP